jgi:hypothetical protein
MPSVDERRAYEPPSPATGRAIARQLQAVFVTGVPRTAIKTAIVTALLAVPSVRTQRLLAVVVRGLWRGFARA